MAGFLFIAVRTCGKKPFSPKTGCSFPLSQSLYNCFVVGEAWSASFFVIGLKLTSKPASTLKNKTGGWRTYIPKTNYSTCIGCGTCAKVCPEGAISMAKDSANNSNRKEKPVIDYDFCKGCGVCAEECPVKAISMELDKK